MESIRRRDLVLGGTAWLTAAMPPAAADTAPAALPHPPRAARRLLAGSRAELVLRLTEARPGDHILLAPGGDFIGEPVEIAKSDIVLRSPNLLQTTVRHAFRLQPTSRNVWLWGLTVSEVWNPFTVEGDDHVIGRCRMIRPGGVTVAVGKSRRLRVFACEFLGQMPWTAAERAQGARGLQPIRMHIRYQRDYPRGLRVLRCLFRGGLRRPIGTVYRSGQPDFLEPGGGGNLGGTETFATFEYLLLSRHPGYSRLPESGAVFDIKTSRVTARHITLKHTRGRLDIRVGHGSVLEGIWLDDGCDGTNIHGGGHLVNGWRVGSGGGALRLLSGDVPWNVSNRHHAYAYRCQLHHVDGPIVLGYRGLPLPPTDNMIFNHRSGDITVVAERGTHVHPRSPLPRVRPFELKRADVGCLWGL